MDSAEFLDLLGNANRRRILQLLARKPCYVTEISDFLAVSPKAVIDHLRKLEEAGLVESQTDDRRRKYFSISRHVRLEVTVSPYEFGTKSAYPASSGLDLTSCRQLHIELDHDAIPDVDEPDPETSSISSLVEALHSLEALENELSLAQRWAQGRITELRGRLESTPGAGESRLVSDVLLAIADGNNEVESLSRAVEAPPQIVEDVLEELAAEDVVYRDGHTWHLDQ